MKKIVFGVMLLCSLTAFTQTQVSVKSEPREKIYRNSSTKINDLVHTKLDVTSITPNRGCMARHGSHYILIFMSQIP